MGNYNPHAPHIAGQEWVPIREENLILSPAANTLEIGHTFFLPANTVVGAAELYINEWPPGRALGQVFVASIYPRDKENLSGPIRSVIIPCNAGLISGSGSVVNALNIADALDSPSDNKFVQFLTSGSSKELSLFFAVNDYSTALTGKRILAVNALYVMAVSNSLPLPTTPIPTAGNSGNWLIENDDGTRSVSYGPPTVHLGLVGVTEVSVKPLGEIDNFWTSTAPNSNPERLPWIYTSSLQNFEISTSAANRVNLHLALAADHSTVNINYVALEVFYCEETRVAYGGTSFGESGFTGGHRPYVFGVNQIRMRTLARAANPNIASGNYLLTLSSANLGEAGLFTSPGHRPIALSQYPELNALRQLYSIPSHQGVQVNIPFPMDENAIGETFTSVETHNLPQLSLHESAGGVEPHVSSGSPLTEPHVYGRQAAAQVYGVNTATQDLNDTILSGSFVYPHARYYARRFGDTTVPLTLAGTFGSGGLALSDVSGSYASTPDDAALDITGDIDLRADLVLSDWTPATTATIVSKWDGAGFRSYLLQVSTAGNLALAWSNDGTAVLLATSTVIVGGFGGERIAIRATMDVNDGGGNRVINFYTGTPTGDLSTVTWVQLGATVTTAGVTSIFNSTTQVEVGGHTNGTSDTINGTVQGVQIRNLIDGTIVANPDFEEQAVGTTVFVDSAGRTWTLTGSFANIVGGVTLSSASITPDEFDALEEILDGWKEVSLRFDVPPTMGAINGNPGWTWSAIGEFPGNRWEIMGACAPAISGTPGDLFNLAPSTQRLTAATYQPPSVTPELTWMPQGVASPYVTGASADPACDAVLFFAQDMPTVSGFEVATLSQAISGIGQNCGVDPCCIPTDILYNRITWDLPEDGAYARDSFSRTVGANWGIADSGQAWTVDTSSNTSWSVSDGYGHVNLTTGSVNRVAVLDTGGSEQDIKTEFFFDSTYPPNTSRVGIIGRSAGTSNGYIAVMNVGSTGIIQLEIAEIVAGVFTTLDSIVLTSQIALGVSSKRFIRMGITGSTIKAKLWAEGTDEPDWQLTVVDISFTSQTFAGTFVRINVSGDFDMRFDNFSVNPYHPAFGYYELQRMDTVEPDWQTIMKATDIGTTAFTDYEARVGIATSYQIRGVDLYEFAGLWSSTLTVTIPSPGVSGGCLEGGHVLVFTSNEHQDGSINLAYSSVWMDNQVEEDFTFPESGFVQLQLMYNKDFYTAFRPLERGGEGFTRTLLVQAAAIAPETLGDFRGLRDMAWDTVNYICVRDEDGNRWFATVIVPSGKVLRDRRLYLAPVQIIEVTDTPTPVDPS